MLQKINTFPYPKCALLIKNLTIFPRILDYQWYSLQFMNNKDYQWPYNEPKNAEYKYWT